MTITMIITTITTTVPVIPAIIRITVLDISTLLSRTIITIT